MVETEQDRQRIRYQEQLRMRDRDEERKRVSNITSPLSLYRELNSGTVVVSQNDMPWYAKFNVFTGFNSTRICWSKEDRLLYIYVNSSSFFEICCFWYIYRQYLFSLFLLLYWVVSHRCWVIVSELCHLLSFKPCKKKICCFKVRVNLMDVGEFWFLRPHFITGPKLHRFLGRSLRFLLIK